MTSMEVDTLSGELVATPTAVLLPVDVDAARGAMAAYQQVVSAILEPSDWQGRPNQRGSFVKKTGWRKIAKAYRLSTELVSQTVERDGSGEPVRAAAVVRALAPNGQHMDGTGFCSATEPRFRDVRGRLKIENDLRTTAETRAKNRAISDLSGYGWVSAEEAEAEVNEPPEHPFGPPASKAELAGLDRALAALLPNEDQLEQLETQLLDDAGGYVPKVVARALMRVARIAAHRPDREEENEAGTDTGDSAAEDTPPTGPTPDSSPDPDPDPDEGTPPPTT